MLMFDNTPRLIKVISGGQIGADRAGLEAAKEVGLETGGWAPLNYRTHEGPNFILRDVYGLREDLSFSYKPRTIKNVADSDGTIIIAKNVNSPGCNLTATNAKLKRKPLLIIPVNDRPLTVQEQSRWVKTAIDFILKHDISIINIAGNRDHIACNYPLAEICKSILIPTFKECKYVPF